MDFEAEIRRRVTLIEKEVEGEKSVSRHILKKANENEGLLLDLNKTVLDLSKKVANIEDQLTLLRADLPGIIAEVVGALLREERERKK